MKNITVKSLSTLIMVSVLFNLNIMLAPESQTALAAANLVKEGSFEGSITDYWGDFTAPGSNRTFQFFRAYDAPYGFGSYSAAIPNAQPASPSITFGAPLAAVGRLDVFTLSVSHPPP